MAQQNSRRFTLIALVFPGAVVAAALIVIASLLPAAPAEIVMQWSGSDPSRLAPPAELILLAAIGVPICLVMWLWTRKAPVAKARPAITIGNAVVAFISVSSVALLVGQLGAEASGALPFISVGAGAVAALVIGAVTLLELRRD